MIRVAFLLIIGAAQLAADVVIIANESVKAHEVSAAELKEVFWGTRGALADGSPVEPVLAKGGEAHEEFLKTYLGKSDAALKNHFKSLVFTGKGTMPRTLASDAEIAAYQPVSKVAQNTSQGKCLGVRFGYGNGPTARARAAGSAVLHQRARRDTRASVL